MSLVLSAHCSLRSQPIAHCPLGQVHACAAAHTCMLCSPHTLAARKGDRLKHAGGWQRAHPRYLPILSYARACSTCGALRENESAGLFVQSLDYLVNDAYCRKLYNLRARILKRTARHMLMAGNSVAHLLCFCLDANSCLFLLVFNTTAFRPTLLDVV